MSPKKVVIGIQARSTSTRLPNKIMERIGDKTVLEHVIYQCENSARYINKYTSKHGMFVLKAILIPTGDNVNHSLHRQTVVEGDEQNVLSRYKKMVDQMNPDFIVRITADCPMIKSAYISKHITTGCLVGYDYLTNVWEKCRTSFDGMDIEFFSRKMFDWCYENSREQRHKEHVTLLMRENPPDWARLGAYVEEIDLSQLKLSIDTIEDLNRVRDQKNRVTEKIDYAIKRFGREHLHRF